jgi:hypothetical protein
MFKKASFENELASSMEKELVGNQLDNKYSFNKLAKVADYLNSAAELLDDTGYGAEADMVMKVLAQLAGEPNPSEDEVVLKEDEFDFEDEPASIELEDDALVQEELDAILNEDLDVSPKNVDKNTEYMQFDALAKHFQNQMLKSAAKKKV